MKEEFGHTYVQFGREYKPESCDDTLKYDSGVVTRLEEKLAFAKQQLNVYAQRAEERKNVEILEAQLRQNELNDIAKFERSLAAYDAVRPVSAPTPLSQARRELMEAVKGASDTVRSETSVSNNLVIAFSMDTLDVCQYDMTQMGTLRQVKQACFIVNGSSERTLERP